MDRSLRDGRHWLQQQMLPGGRVRGDRDVNSFGKPIWGLWSAGAPRAVIKRLLDHLAAKAVQPNGDLGFAAEVKTHPAGLGLYRSLYCLIVAAATDHPLARNRRIRQRLQQYQDARTGAVYGLIGHDPAAPQPNPFHAALLTSTSVHAFLGLGMPDRAVRSGEWLARLVRLNRTHMRRDGLFYFQMDLKARLITAVPPNRNWTHVLSNAKPKQQFFQTGAIMAALARLADSLLSRRRPDRARARKFLEAAFELLRFEQTMLAEGYEWPQKCKIAWGGGDLLTTALRHRRASPEQLLALYRATRATVVSTFFDSQRPDGSWGGDSIPLQDNAPEFDYDYKLLRGQSNAPLRPTGSKTCAWAQPIEITGEFLGEIAVARRGISFLIKSLEK